MNTVHVVRNACGYTSLVSGNALNSGRFNLGSSFQDPQIAGMFSLLIFSPDGLSYLVISCCVHMNFREQTIFAAPRKEMLPIEVLSGNLVIETFFLNKEDIVAKTSMRIFYDA